MFRSPAHVLPPLGCSACNPLLCTPLVFIRLQAQYYVQPSLIRKLTSCVGTRERRVGRVRGVGRASAVAGHAWAGTEGERRPRGACPQAALTPRAQALQVRYTGCRRARRVRPRSRRARRAGRRRRAPWAGCGVFTWCRRASRSPMGSPAPCNPSVQAWEGAEERHEHGSPAHRAVGNSAGRRVPRSWARAARAHWPCTARCSGPVQHAAWQR